MAFVSRASVCFALANFSLALICVLYPSVVKSQNPDGSKAKQEKYQARKDTEVIKGLAFERYFTTDKFDREITFYLSKPPADQKADLPLIVCIQGSGSQSVFLEIETPEGKKVVSGGPEAVAQKIAGESARILVAEKPEVKFLVQPERPGSSEEATDEFNREFTLERWTEALNAATTATLKLPGIDNSKVMALGHSEGAQLACTLAAENSRVTHVGFMAGGGPTQLFDFIQFARSGAMFNPDATPEERVSDLLAGWKRVQEDPEAHDKFFLGHAYRRWSSFMTTSPIEAILKSEAKVFIAQGTKDTNSLPISAEVLYAELLARGRDVQFEHVEGGDHAFRTESDKRGEGWVETHKKAIDWFMNTQTRQEPSAKKSPTENDQ